MKLLTGAVVLATAANVAAAVAHNHRHMHHHNKKRATEVVTVPGPTVVMYKFGDNFVSEKEVCEGINNGTYAWAEGTQDKPDCGNINSPAPAPAAPVAESSPSPDAPAAPKETPKEDPKADAGNAFLQDEPSNSGPKDDGESDSGASRGGSDDVEVDTSGLSGYDSKIASNSNVDREFPDGEVDCSEFPEKYGAIPIDWMEIGGWAGIQKTSISNGVIGDIRTAVANEGCSDGSYCSYACPPGYQKSQWPEQTSSTSVGGLLCKGGKLTLTNKALSSKLCMKGTGMVNVENKLGKNVAICRTDYPGTESEVVPLNTQAGKKYPLTCPDAKNYYQHKGSSTSAQYYVNMAGVSVDKACAWGQDETDKGDAYGNWAPTNMGVGTDGSGNTFISLLSTEQNYPKDVVSLKYNIELKGDFGGAKCFYTYKDGKGQYCTGGTVDNPSGCQSQGQFVGGSGPVPGCTVQIYSGTASYVLS